MAYTVNYDELDYGDETRGEGVQTVGLPHDEASDGVPVGAAVSFDGTKIVAADENHPPIGVLYTYQFHGENNAVRQDRNATVLVAGKVKAQVESDVEAGDMLDNANVATDGETAGNLSNGGDQTSSFVALTDAQQQDNGNPNGAGGESYAEVLVR
jgi:hypothetical protein